MPGLQVGDIVGECEGTRTVGNDVGMKVGYGVGISELQLGGTVGVNDGNRVGEDEGSTVGEIEALKNQER